ncbi:CysS/YqeB C-terminal domain-containing protein [Nonomuraea sp. CA-141351]|uniref:CysS/YqeB C-terminal domain-containing protein n=1 Tax=Nonomuraea sp. CA-141351 TaxID=3239996 RepID=UPI003D8DF11C
MPALLVLMGSGETSPTMVEIHRAAARTLRTGARAVLLDTPYAFQENAADISARARRYFAHSVGLEVEVAAGITGADWIFSGPGSPTYALDRWAGSGVAGDLRARVRAREGVTVLASAAACTAGLATVPVYEIYKVGADPHWREGIDLLEPLGLQAVLIPHFDNAEGGTHDTRYCYLGERRLSRMERELPPGTAVLGLDEHTALVIDLESESVRVAGRGGLTVRRPGSQTVLPTGTHTDLAQLRRLAEGGTSLATTPPPPAEPAPAEVTLEETIHTCEELFKAAVGKPDMVAAAQTVLDLEAEIVKWAADTEEDSGGVEQARELMRLLIARLGELASAAGLRSLGLPSLVEPLLALRSRLREEGRYEVADALRAAMLEGGIVVEDTPDGPRWTCTP